jgi:signal transduction histidine kinase
VAAAPQWTDDGFLGLFDLSPMFQTGLDKFLQSSLTRCAAWFRASGASIFLRQEGEAIYHLSAKAGGQSKIPSSATIEAGKGLAGMAIQEGRPRVVHGPLDVGGRNGKSVNSSMIIPLIAHRLGVIGVLNLSRGEGEPNFNEIDLEQAMALAGQVALAVSNAQLVERLNAAVRLSQESRERLEGVLDSVPGGVLVFAPDGKVLSSSSWTIREGLFSKQLGKPQTEIGQAVEEFSSRSVKAGRPLSMTVNGKDDDRTWILQSQPLNSGGCVVTVQEITEHERALREMHRMSRLAEIGRMTAAIAHEFRNPLTGIRSAAQMIQQDPDLGEEFAGIIQEEVIKLNNLCDDFLEFARPLKLDVTLSQLSDPIRRVASLVEADFREKKVELTVEMASDEPTMNLDSRRIEQVLHNLLRNALEATPADGGVALRQHAWGFEIEDTGEGMDEATIGKLFSPFFTTKAQGTGLGLSTVRKIVEAHGGSISVTSSPGEGARFRVRLTGQRHG